MPAKKTTGKVGRSSKTGKFVTVEYAKKHPSTTEVERIKRPSKTSRKHSTKSANDLMLEAWEYTYKHRHERLD